MKIIPAEGKKAVCPKGKLLFWLQFCSKSRFLLGESASFTVLEIKLTRCHFDFFKDICFNFVLDKTNAHGTLLLFISIPLLAAIG